MSLLFNVFVVAKCCSIFSALGFIFLIILGSLFQKQPLYLKSTASASAAASGCFYGGLLLF